MSHLLTTLGRLPESDLGLILPHEHIFVDFRVPQHRDHAVAEPSSVLELMAPEVSAARDQGISAMVDCTPVGVGRRADIAEQVSHATGMPFVLPTGIYREPWVPDWAKTASEDELADWMLRELTDRVEGTATPAGWIKLSVGDDGITPIEAKILRAAARAGSATNALIGVHTQRGRVVHDQLDIIEDAGYTAERFVWIHAQNDRDLELQLSIARRGAWLEFDGIGWGDDDYYLEVIPQLLEAGLLDQLMLSQDRGWYDPALPGGGTIKPFTHFVDEFLPRLRQEVDEQTITTLTQTNPFRAFAR